MSWLLALNIDSIWSFQITVTYYVLSIFLWLASTSMIIRRLHDIGRSHWLLTSFYVIYCLYETINIPIIALISLEIYLFIILFYRSQSGINKWGYTPEKHFGFFEASKKFIISSLDFKSRSRRSEYFWSFLIIFLICFVLVVIEELFIK